MDGRITTIALIVGLMAVGVAAGQTAAPDGVLVDFGRFSDPAVGAALWRPGQCAAVPRTGEHDAPDGPAQFEQLLLGGPVEMRSSESRGITLLVNAALAPQITESLTLYVNDLTAEGYRVRIETMSGGSASELRGRMRRYYASGDEGAVLIGTTPLAWYQVDREVFPTDLYFMDVDGTWLDTDRDGDFDQHLAGAGDRTPELYVTRLWVDTQTWDTPKNLIDQYFAKVHAYRQGQLRMPYRALEYVEEDWCMHSFYFDTAYGDAVTRADFGHLTRKDDLLAKLIGPGYQFVHLVAHSGHTGHCFGNTPTFAAAYAHVYVYSPSMQAAYLRMGSDESLKAWLNGTNVFTRVKDGGYNAPWLAEEYVVPVALRSGWNRLLCKVTQDAGWWRTAMLLEVRITDAAGQTLPDLTYQLADPNVQAEPPWTCSGSIHRWLVNGVYENYDYNTRLSRDYLGGEANVRPHTDAAAPFDRWRVHEFADEPTRLDLTFTQRVYPEGGFLSSYDVHDLQPRALFYNLYCCGAGQFWRDNCVSDTYIFGTATGLLSIATTTGGGIWHTSHLLAPLSENATFGQAFFDYWHQMAPYDELQLGYGVVMRGDPTLRLFKRGDLNGDYSIDFDDIDPFVQALLDRVGYLAANPYASPLSGDCNRDGQVDFDDINAFVKLLVSGG